MLKAEASSPNYPVWIVYSELKRGDYAVPFFLVSKSSEGPDKI